MTPEEIDKIEAGRELDARVLVHVLGWRWRMSNVRKLWQLIPPPEEANGWEPAPMCSPEMDAEIFSYTDHWPEKSERFSDWDCACVRRNPRRSSFEVGAPHVSTAIVAAWTVVEAMKKKGVEIMLWSDAAGITCRFHDYERMEESCSASAPLSICRAAWKIGFSEKETPCQT